MKAKLLKIVNPFVVLSFLTQFVTMVFFKLQDWAGVDIPSWISDLHDINGAVFAGLIVFHVILNWGWIKTNVFRIKAK